MRDTDVGTKGEKPKRPERRRAERTGGARIASQLFDRLVLPIASEADATATCTAIRPYVDVRDTELVVVHVVEKNPGYPDNAPPCVMRERADRIVQLARDHFAAATLQISSEVRYGPNVVEEVFAAADAVDATAIGFVPRPGRRWTRILAGDVAYRLVTSSRRPIVVFPHPNANE